MKNFQKIRLYVSHSYICTFVRVCVYKRKEQNKISNTNLSIKLAVNIHTKKREEIKERDRSIFVKCVHALKYFDKNKRI
jgi:ribosomal protein L32E